MSAIDIRLSAEEMTVVTLVAGLRRSESKSKGRKDNHGFNGKGAWDIEIEGAAAEMAYCKHRGTYWSCSVNSFKGADVGTNVQVRHTANPNGKLVVRDGDNPEHYYVLLTGTAPNMKLHGWYKGADAMKKEFRDAPCGRSPAYFVPQDKLKKFKEK